MLRRLYDRTLELSGHPQAPRALAALAFVESSVFPIPPDVALIPMALARRDRAFHYAAICTVASVIGGLAGYAIGYFLFETLGRALLDLYGYAEAFASFTTRYNDYGAWIVFTAGLTPFPYKVITIASGVTELDLLVFTAASIVARGLRFFVLAALLWQFGPPVQRLIDRYFGLLTVVFVVLLIGGFVVIRYLL